VALSKIKDFMIPTAEQANSRAIYPQTSNMPVITAMREAPSILLSLDLTKAILEGLSIVISSESEVASTFLHMCTITQ
jgi:hypothetical protein